MCMCERKKEIVECEKGSVCVSVFVFGCVGVCACVRACVRARALARVNVPPRRILPENV